jgi:hypothetical protein
MTNCICSACGNIYDDEDIEDQVDCDNIKEEGKCLECEEEG